MHLVLAIPDLLADRGAGTARPAAPGLAALLAAAAPPARDADGYDAALAAHFGIPRQADWPIAAIRAAALGLETAGDYWLAADPVTLVAGRDDVRLAGVVADLSRSESDALVATLNAHFASDGLAFVAPRPDAIFAHIAVRPGLVTRPPVARADESLRRRLPGGPDADQWQRWQSEIQMLLHDHPVNAARESEGRPPANSVWFSAGGTLPPQPVRETPIRTCADSGVAVALAAHAGAPAEALPGRLADALAKATGAGKIVVALGPGIGLGAIERSWGAPAREALGGGRVVAVTVVTDDAGDAVTWHARRPGPLRRLASRFAAHDFDAIVASAAATRD
jgi:hypothetical protein